MLEKHPFSAYAVAEEIIEQHLPQAFTVETGDYQSYITVDNDVCDCGCYETIAPLTADELEKVNRLLKRFTLRVNFGKAGH